MNPIESGHDPVSSLATKVHHRLLPMLIAAWFIAYIDRFNVSFAALQMNRDLGLSSAAFGLGAGVFFLGYAAFEIPSTLLLARIGPRRWLSRILVSWGIVSVAMAWTQGAATFYALRLLLGIAEAGCFPGIAFYVTLWLPPRQRAAALASISTMAMVSGIAGAPMAAALLSLNGRWGLGGWQWLFIAEGVPAVVIGLVLLKWLPDGPESVNWLTNEERALVPADRPEHALPSGASLATVLSEPRYWMWATAFGCIVASGSALRLFQPMFLKMLTGLSDVMVAFLTIVPSLAGVIATIYVGRRSTHMDERRWHAAIPALLAAAGLAMLGASHGIVAALLLSSLATVGVATQPPLFAAVSNVASGEVSLVAIAFVNSVSAVGAFIGPYLVGYALNASGSLTFVCLVSGVVMAAGALLIVITSESHSWSTIRRAIAAP